MRYNLGLYPSYLPWLMTSIIKNVISWFSKMTLAQSQAALPSSPEIPLSCLKAKSDQAVILIADPDSRTRDKISQCLRQAGHHTVEVQDGVQAIQLIEAVRHTSGPGAFRLDMVLSKAKLPYVNGYEVCRQVRHSFSSDKVGTLLLTHKSNPKEVQRWLDAGGDDFLEVSTQENCLLARVGHFIECLDAHRRNRAMARVTKWGRDLALIEKSNSENFCEIHYQDGRYVEDYVTLAELQRYLCDDYIRVNRSTIINRYCVRKIEKTGPPSKPTVHFVLSYGRRLKTIRVSRSLSHNFLTCFE